MEPKTTQNYQRCLDYQKQSFQNKSKINRSQGQISQQQNNTLIEIQPPITQFGNYSKDIQTKLANQEQLQWKRWNFNDQRNQRFCLQILGPHLALKNVPSFEKLFSNIKEKSQIKYINISFDRKLPKELQGAIIQLNDISQTKLYLGLLALLQYFFETQTNLDSGQFTINLVLPRMLVSLVMGKQGKLLNRIKNLTNSNLFVFGPYKHYSYQSIQINSPSIEKLCEASMMMYNIAYKLLKNQKIILKQGWLNDNIRCKTGILISSRIYQKVYLQYKTYVQSIKINLQIQYQFIDYRSSKSKSRQKNQYIFMVTGKVSDAKILINHFLRLIWFEGYLDDELIYILNSYQAKSITNLGGKIIRDLSSKCGYVFMEVLEKDQKYNRLLIKGSLGDKIKAVCLIAEFICFDNRIIQQEMGKERFNYFHQLNAQKKIFQPNWVQSEETDEKDSDSFKKTKKIKKFQRNDNNKKNQGYPQYRRSRINCHEEKQKSMTPIKMPYVPQSMLMSKYAKSSIRQHIVASIITQQMKRTE